MTVRVKCGVELVPRNPCGACQPPISPTQRCRSPMQNGPIGMLKMMAMERVDMTWDDEGETAAGSLADAEPHHIHHRAGLITFWRCKHGPCVASARRQRRPPFYMQMHLRRRWAAKARFTILHGLSTFVLGATPQRNPQDLIIILKKPLNQKGSARVPRKTVLEPRGFPTVP